MQIKNYDKAFALARDLNHFQPNTLLILDSLVRAQMALGKEEAAIETVDSMYSLAVESATWLHRIGKHRISSKDFAGARQSLQKALGVDPGFVPALADLASLDIRDGRTDKALARAQDLQALHPESAVGYVLEGEALMHERRFSEAAEAYEEGQVKEPSTHLLALIYSARRAANDLSAIVPILEKWVAAHPGDQEAPGLLARAYLETGECRRKGSARAFAERYAQPAVDPE